jgi:hypothetical protein
MDQYVVTTRVLPVRENGKIIRHAYGPYPKLEALGVKREIRADARLLGYVGRLEVNVLKLVQEPEQ